MLSQEAFKQLPIFIISMSRWDGDISSASWSLAKVLGRTNPTYYVDYPYTLADVWRERKLPSVQRRMNALVWGKNYVQNIPDQPPLLKAATPRAVIPLQRIPQGSIYKKINDINNTTVAKLIRKICKENGYKDFLFINSFNPIYLQEIEQYLQPTLSVYQSRDAIEAISDNGLRGEITCVQHYDLSIATSTQLCTNISARTGKEVIHFPNGGDATLFRTAIDNTLPKPKELENITTPIIGYTGAVCQRIDYELIEKTAAAHPDKTIVMVGPRQDKIHSPIDLDTIQNLVLTGPKKITELPAYLQYFDCAILPFKYTTLTAGIYPLKINEYLAAGKAVVATHFSKDVAIFKESIWLRDTHEAFIKAIDEAVQHNTPQEKEDRYTIAAGNSWEKRVELFWELAYNTYLSIHKR